MFIYSGDLVKMGAHAYINGVCHYDDSMDGDIEKDLSNKGYFSVYCHTSDEGDLYFSFGVIESGLSSFIELLEKWKLYKSFDLDLEYPIEVYLTIWYESNNEQVDCIRVRHGKISHRKTFA